MNDMGERGTKVTEYECLWKTDFGEIYPVMFDEKG